MVERYFGWRCISLFFISVKRASEKREREWNGRGGWLRKGLSMF